MSFFLVISMFACNQCKKLCDDMASFAENECGYAVSSEMKKECNEQQSGKSWNEKKECRDVRPDLEEEWDCDELSIYFESPSSSEDDTGN